MTRPPSTSSPAVVPDASDVAVPLAHLDDLWFQVAGTLCNLACCHCFISCSPTNTSFGFLSRQTVRTYLEESVSHGVKEYYFTGGEPFLNPEMTSILADALQFGPATVLTNGTLFHGERARRERWLETLAVAARDSLYSLEFRVSIDGFSPATNDPIRGEGTFDRAMRGVRRLVESGFLPVITAARTWPIERDEEVLDRFRHQLIEHGYRRPRIKLLPALLLGAEQTRSRGYLASERITAEMMGDFDVGTLVCNHSRVVTDRGVFVCPILLEADEARVGDTLAAASGPFSVTHGACYTCYQFGSICSNPSSTRRRGE